ncbi:hypothetical protein LR48_Vigan05g223800 [Vigna angularis]|uniref:Uncharacterized protein n=1 Tax=Phaseolus angularis TaxID=3914 RepID=A0A0L9UPG6_PHAAN|nr:hypothetical protein LR48_Vigan05g223800 [Vigna angularis]
MGPLEVVGAVAVSGVAATVTVLGVEMDLVVAVEYVKAVTGNDLGGDLHHWHDLGSRLAVVGLTGGGVGVAWRGESFSLAREEAEKKGRAEAWRGNRWGLWRRSAHWWRPGLAAGGDRFGGGGGACARTGGGPLLAASFGRETLGLCLGSELRV